MLAARGIDVSHGSARHCVEKFGREFSNRICRRAPARGDKWHLDEVVIYDPRCEAQAMARSSTRTVSFSTF